MRQRSGSWGALFAAGLASLLGAAAAAGGLAVQLSDPTLTAPPADWPWQAGVALLGALGALAAGRRCLRERRRHFLYSLVLAGLLAATTVAACEWVAGFFVPPWPALGLHGVSPADVGAWASRAGTRAGAVGVNSWGQRDRERSLRTRPGVRRIVFIGDSFLEESVTVPLPLAVERTLGREDLEVLNLGVSATDPDEYYWRLRAIGLPLGAERVVVVVYAGNDFTVGPSLGSFHGLAAPYPKRSLLSALGLTSLNHLAANRMRPVTRIWRGAGDLQATERRLHEIIRQTPDAGMPDLLAGAVAPPVRPHLRAHLMRRELSTFYAGLRSPDAGLFRSYYLEAALQSADPVFAGAPAVDGASISYVLELLTRMDGLCRGRGVGFTLAVAPEASQVDPRFQRFWGSVSRLTEAKSHTSLLARRLVSEARARGIAVVDLGEVLRGEEGTYLNLDGHWSERGVSLVARELARHLEERPGPGRRAGAR